MPDATSRGAFPFPEPEDPLNPPGDLEALATRIAAIGALDSQGLESARPPADAAHRGWYYYATDTDHLWRCDGVEWNQIDPPTGVDDAFYTATVQHINDADPHGTAGIADNAITSAKIVDGAVTVAELAAAVRESIFDIGDIKWKTTGTTPGPSWQVADGTPISRTTFAAYFAMVGTRFGNGDGTTTFAKPNLVGSVPEGVATDGAVAQKAAALSHDHPKAGSVSSGNATHQHGVTVNSTGGVNTGGKSTGGADHYHSVNGATGGANNPGGMSHLHHAVWSPDQWSSGEDHNLEHGHDFGVNSGWGGTDHVHRYDHGHGGSSDIQNAGHGHLDTITISANTAGSTTKLVPWVKVA